GPDPDHAGAEVCFSSASDVVEIADVTIKSSPVSLSTLVYPDLAFVHQAWLTEDHRFLFVGDELDERNFGTPTRTIVLDVSDLDNPAYVYTYEAATTNIDHNLYVLGNRIYEANYTTGLRIIEFTDPGAQDLMEVAFFDTYPADDGVSFDGAWSVYPFFASGNLIVNDDTNGLFVLTPQ
ncbi:MAG: choice-of-anchor B family protein, partial [Woeseiaceae bacterium]|nr:choice-of-anchor B family protein [Woeseiaceae bacterium]